MKRNYKKSLAAFTIVELLVVIVIIGILATITMVSYSGISSKANLAAMQSDLSNNSNILKMYNALYGSYPNTLDASNCPTAPNIDTNYCLKFSNGISFTYQPSSTTGVASDFSLYAQKDTTYLRTTASNGPSAQTLTKLCPYGFIVIPGSPTYGTSDFCVMKYEAKIQGNDNGNQTYNASFIPESRASGTPWVGISQTNAIAESQTACTGCHLITEPEWMTIAQNVLNNPINWSSGTVGTGFIYSGHSDNNPATPLPAGLDNDGYYGTGNTALAGATQKRTLTLSNGEIIWDMSGNDYDWTAGQTTGGQPGVVGESAFTWKDFIAVTSPGSIIPDVMPAGTGISGASTWAPGNGIGRLMSNVSDVSLRGFVRGGYLSSSGGVLTLAMSYAPSGASPAVGFRVASN